MTAAHRNHERSVPCYTDLAPMSSNPDELNRTGGEWVVEALHAEGVHHVFGIPGVHNLAVYDALIRDARGTWHGRRLRTFVRPSRRGPGHDGTGRDQRAHTARRIVRRLSAGAGPHV